MATKTKKLNEDIQEHVCAYARFGLSGADQTIVRAEREIRGGGNIESINDVHRAKITLGKEEQKFYARMINKYCEGVSNAATS